MTFNEFHKHFKYMPNSLDNQNGYLKLARMELYHTLHRNSCINHKNVFILFLFQLLFINLWLPYEVLTYYKILDKKYPINWFGI